jgi:hypothetical protein
MIFFTVLLSDCRETSGYCHIYLFSVENFMQKRIWVAGERRKGRRGLSFPLVGKSFFSSLLYRGKEQVRPKARGLAQNGGLLGWLEESDPAGCDFVRDGRAIPPVFSVPYRLP